MFFSSSKKKAEAARAAAQRPARDPFVAVPILAEGVREETGAEGTVVLVRRVPVPMRYGRLLGRFLGRERVARTILDENGTFFWRQVDGVRTLGQIADAVRVKMNCPEAQARESVLAFTKDLMKRNLLSVKIRA